MKSYALNAEPRTDLGKKATKALRAESKIPAVINGGEVVTLPYEGALKPGQKVVEIAENKTSNEKKGIIVTDITLKTDDVRKLIYTPDIFVIDLTINGEAKKAVLKDIQFHPVSDEILHIDLLEVYDNKPVVMEVPVALEGHAEGVKAGGKLTLSMKKLKVTRTTGRFAPTPTRPSVLSLTARCSIRCRRACSILFSPVSAVRSPRRPAGPCQKNLV